MKIGIKDLRIKLIKPFYGHNNWRTKPLSIGRVLNYGANPERGQKLIKDRIAIIYKKEE